MKNSRPPLFTLTAAVALLSASVLPTRADDALVSYPKDAPVFTVDPGDAELGANPVEQAGPAHPLHLTEPDGSKVPAYTIVTVPVQKSLAADLEEFVHAMASSMQVTGAKYATDPLTELPYDSETQTVTGTIGGDKITTTTVGFRMKDKNFFAMVSAPAANGAARAKLAFLLGTVQAIE